MKKKAIGIAVVLLVFFAVGTVFAQTASQVTTWLNNAERDAEKAYKLASSKDAKDNINTISDLIKSSVTELIKVENALNTNEKLYDSSQRNSWLRKMNNIKDDLDSVSKLVSMLL
jgi:predicted PurR-regulated permease PerM